MHLHMDRIPSERASQEEQNGTNFSFVSPSSEELRAFEIHCCDDLYHGHTVELEASIGTHNSTLEGAMKLKFVLFSPSFEALTNGIISYLSQIFQYQAENHGL